MDYQRFPYDSVQEAFNRIALLEWFVRNDEATDQERGELVRLKEMLNVS